MSAVREAILDDILANPDDDTPRLVMADWLEENGNPERAEFIRVQIELARLPEDDERRCEFEDREHLLLTRHREAWASELPEGCWLGGPRHHPFRRGFVEDLHCAPGPFLDTGRLRHPITSAHIAFGDPGDLAKRMAILHNLFDRVLASPAIERLTALDLNYNGLTPEHAERLAATRRLRGLCKLVLSGNEILARGVAAIATSQHLTSLESLDIFATRGTQEGIGHLAVSPLVERLRDLGVGGGGEGEAGPILACRRLHRLRSLGLSADGLGLEAILRLCQNVSLANLERLDLGHNPIPEEGLSALADCPHLANLRDLRLEDVPVTAHGLNALARSPQMRRLRSLHVANIVPGGPRFASSIGPGGVIALASSPHITGLRRLWLGRQGIGDAGAHALAGWPGLKGLRWLVLSQNGIGPEGAMAIAAMPCVGLETLSLYGNGVGDVGAAALSNARFRRLRSLDLSRCGIGPTGGEALLRADWPDTLTELDLHGNRLDGMEEAFRARFGDIVRI